MSVQQYESSLFKSKLGHAQLRELTRQNSHIFSEEQGFDVLLSSDNLGPLGVPNQSERIDIKFTLHEINQHHLCANFTKEFIVSAIYLGREALQGTREQTKIQKFFK